MHAYVISSFIFALQTKFIQCSLVFLFFLQSIAERNALFLLQNMELVITGSSCTVCQKKKKNTSINSNINYHREMKPEPINMDYGLLQFDASKFFLGVLLHGGSLPNFNFFNVNFQIENNIVKFTTQIAWIKNFTTFLTLV